MTKEIRILKPGDEESLEEFLLPLIDSSMFLIGNMRAAGLEDKGSLFDGTYAALCKQGTIRGVAAHYWNNNIVFQDPTGSAALWKEAVSQSGRPVGGLLGPDEQVAPVMNSLSMGKGNIQMDSAEKLYSLDLDHLIIPENLAKGSVSGRRIVSDDIDLMTDWRSRFAQETINEEQNEDTRDSHRKNIDRSLKEGTTWILEEEGNPVACCSFNAVLREAVQLGGVWTYPEYRSRGFGRAAVAKALLDAREEGIRKGVLFTGNHNISAQKAYEAVGFSRIGSYRLILFKKPMYIPGQ